MTNAMKATAEGNFAKTPFANVLLYARERKMTGSLVITIQPDHPEDVAAVDVAGISTLVLEGGSLVALQTPSRRESLAGVLHDLGTLSDDLYARVLEAARASSHGDEVSTLLRLRACSPTAIDGGLRDLARRRVIALFGHRLGSYAYYADTDMLAGAERLRAPDDLLPIVWRGFAAQRPDEALVANVIGKLGARTIKLRDGHEFDRFEFGDELGLAPAQLRTAPASLDQLTGLAPDPSLLRAMIYLLALTKQVEVVTASVSLATSVPPPMVSSPPRPPPVPVEARKPPPTPTAAMVAPQATATSAAPPADEGRVSLTSEPRVSMPGDPRIKEAQSHLDRMQHRSYFEMFELHEGATLEEIRVAFPKFAAQWHPDKAPSPELYGIYVEVFALYNTAQSVLSNRESRQQYEGTLHGGGGTPAAQKKVAAVLDTVQDVHRAEIAMRRRDLVEAERLLRHVVAQSEDDTSALTLLGQCLLEADATRNAQEVIGMMAKVLAATDQSSDRAWYFLGIAVKASGDLKRAHASFKRAIECNPNNVEASRQMRLIEMRVQQQREAKAAEKSIGGLFNKFLKK